MGLPANLTPARDEIAFYVTGRAKLSREWAIVKYTKVDKGWLAESVYGDAPELRTRYVCDETREELATWHPCDFSTRTLTSPSYEEALEHLVRKRDGPPPGQ